MASKHLKTKSPAAQPSHAAGRHAASAEKKPSASAPAHAAGDAPKKEKASAVPAETGHETAAAPAKAPASGRPKHTGKAGGQKKAPSKAAPAGQPKAPKKTDGPKQAPEPAAEPAPQISNDAFRAALLTAAASRGAKKKDTAPAAPKKAPEKPQPKPAAKADKPADRAEKPDGPKTDARVIQFPFATAHIPDEKDSPKPDASGGRKKKKAGKQKRRKKNDAGGMDFQADEPAARKLTGHDIRVISILLVFILVLIAAAALLWYNRGALFGGDDFVLSLTTATSADDEYIFDAGSGEEFASTGGGLAVSTAGAVELLSSTGSPVASYTVQMDNTAITGCKDFALFYDLGGTKIVQLTASGSAAEITAAGNIVSATVSDNGYTAVTTDATGYRALVTVYDPSLNIVYEWYSSTAWVMSAMVSPDSRSMAVLSYTMSGSEILLFRLNQEEAQASFPAEEVLLLNFSWLDNSRLCACSSEAAYFFDTDGTLTMTYPFDGLYLTDCSYDGEGFIVLALSQYRSATSSTLVSLDSRGSVLGTADITGELISLAVSGTEVLVLCPTDVTLYTSALQEKSSIPGLTGFKFAAIRGHGEALLVASNYAEVYTFE